jgi:hypothetical protein
LCAIRLALVPLDLLYEDRGVLGAVDDVRGEPEPDSDARAIAGARNRETAANRVVDRSADRRLEDTVHDASRGL